MFDWDRVRKTTFVNEIRFHESVESTNSVALEYCRLPELRTPLLVGTDRQTAGRGRGTNAWWSARGALTFSLVIHPASLGLASQVAKTSLAAGLSVCRAIQELLPQEDVRLKWPNDVQLRRHKVSGVLIEVGPRSTGTLVIGIGVNVNNSFQSAPADLRSTGTSLIDATGTAFSLHRVLVCILRELETQLGRLAAGDPGLAADWQARCALNGRTVEVDTGSRRTTGVCRGIDEEGALVLLTDGGRVRMFGGVVTTMNDEIPNDEGSPKSE